MIRKRNFRKRPCLVLMAGAFCCSAYAASFDCSKAKRPVEQAICSTPALSALDSRMATLYQAELASLTSRSVGEARVDQLQWLAWMQQVCRADEQKPAATAACLQPLYEARVKLLRRAVTRRGGLTFFTRTQYLANPESGQQGAPPYPGFGTLQASWPSADTEDAQWTAWNQATESTLLQLSSHRPDNSSDVAKTVPGWSNTLANGSDTTAQVSVKSIEHGRVTATARVEGMAHGGAHGYEVSETMTWLLSQKRLLAAGDIFRANSGWERTLARQAWAQLQAGAQHTSIYSEVNGPEAKALLNVVTDPANWTLEQDGLHISYPEYTVAPRVAPPDDAVIAWQVLQPAMNTGFEQP